MFGWMQSAAEAHPVAVSLTYYAVFICLGELTVNVIRSRVSEYYQQYAMYATTTWVMYTATLENGNISQNYGSLGMFILLCLISIWAPRYAAHCACSSNPLRIIAHRLGNCCHTRVELAALFASQFVGMLLSYQTAVTIWSMGMTQYHRNRLAHMSLSTCESSLAVSPIVGVCIEFCATFFSYVIDKKRFTESWPNAEKYTKIALFSAIAIFGSQFTGYYLNPLKAGMITFGCAPTAIYSYVLVYCIGPVAAIVAAVWVLPTTTDSPCN